MGSGEVRSLAAWRRLSLIYLSRCVCDVIGKDKTMFLTIWRAVLFCGRLLRHVAWLAVVFVGLCLLLLCDACLGQTTLTITMTDTGSCSRGVFVGTYSTSTGNWLETYPGGGSFEAEAINSSTPGVYNEPAATAGTAYAFTENSAALVTGGSVASGGVNGPLGSAGAVTITVGTTGNCAATNACVSTNVFYYIAVQNNNNYPVSYQAMTGGACGTPVVPNFGNTFATAAPGGVGVLNFGLTFQCPSSVIPASSITVATFTPQDNVTLTTEGFPGNVVQYATPGVPCPGTSISESPSASPPATGPGGESSSGSGGQPTVGPPTDIAPTSFGTNDMGSTNGNIQWVTNGASADNGTVEEGFSALYDAITKGFQAQHADMNTLFTYQSASTNLQGQTVVGVNNVSNQLTLVRSAIQTMTNLQQQTVNTLSNQLVQNTNWLAGLSNREFANMQAVTNLLGVSLISNLSFSIGLSNAVVGVSNAVASGNGSLSNVMVLSSEFLSNAFAGAIGGLTNGTGTNGFDVASITNDADANMRATTNTLGNLLGGVSNSLAWSNQASAYGAFDTNGMVAAGALSASVGSNSLAGVVSGLPTGTAMAQGVDRVGSAPGLAWVINVPGGYSLDCNPMDYPAVSGIAAWCRAAVSWLLIGWLVYSCSKRVVEAINASGAFRQASSAATAPGISSALALGMAGLISVVMLAIPAFCVAWFVPYVGVVSSSPFISGGSAMDAGLWLADQFFPVSLLVAALVVRIVFLWLFGAIVWFVINVTRFITG